MGPWIAVAFGEHAGGLIAFDGDEVLVHGAVGYSDFSGGNIEQADDVFLGRLGAGDYGVGFLGGAARMPGEGTDDLGTALLGHGKEGGDRRR